MKFIPAELTIKPVRVARGESPAAQALQVGMTHNGFNEPLAETMRAIVFMDEDIAKIGEDRIIADDPRKTDLLLAVVEPEDKRVGKRSFRPFARSSLCPVGAREKVADGINVEAGRVSADGEIIFVDFNQLWHGVSVS